jgi:CRISP-associated protein Cas1
MTDRIVEVAIPARLSVRDAQLVIACDGTGAVTTPLSEIAVLLIAHPQVSLTQAVLSRIAETGGSVVTIDGNFLPASMLLPVQAHFLQTERFARQIELGLVLRKRLWQKIVRAKIVAQGQLLRQLHGSDGGLVPLAARVRSGDPDNLEAQAARRYWALVFGDPKFRRGSEGPDQNQHLDYGYAVLRAAVARALCAAGLHPSIGLRHRNRYDAFCLAADVMEPFRPLVDRRVASWIQDHDPTERLDSAAKQALLGVLAARYWVDGEQRGLFDVLSRTANSLARCIVGDGEDFAIPELPDECGPDADGLAKRPVSAVRAESAEEAAG